MENTNKLHQKLVYIQQNLKAPKKQHNNFGNYDFRSCEDILEAVKPLLGDCTLTISDEVVNLGDRFYIKATVKLTDGTSEITNFAFARESEDKKGMDDSQITGATSSYARKYALNGLFAIDDNKDSDTTNNGRQEKTDEPASEAQRKMIFAVAKQKGIDAEKAKETIKEYYKLDSFEKLTKSQAKKAIDSLLKKPDVSEEKTI